jgi:pyruvate dehydrogenase E2 component (dihydrolipoamide acetyltransferase)
VHVVVMPKLGLTMQEAELVRWLVDVGGDVRIGEAICEVETDKITMEVESPADGVLLRRVEAGDVIAVGVGIAVVGAAGEASDDVLLHGDTGVAAPGPELAAQEPTVPTAVPVAAASGGGDPAGRRPVAPVARRLAAELGVDLSAVTGTGPSGRVVRRDVEAAAGLVPSEEGED